MFGIHTGTVFHQSHTHWCQGGTVSIPHNIEGSPKNEFYNCVAVAIGSKALPHQNIFPPKQKMYQIPLRKANEIKSFNVIDMQGSLETRPEKDKPLNSVTLGSLTFRNDTANSKEERCSLIIDRQKCDGKKVPLKKSLLICKKVINPQTNQTEYIITGIAKEKIQFRSRPTPLSPSPQQQKIKPLDLTEEEQSKQKKKDNIARTLFFSPAKKK